MSKFIVINARNGIVASTHGTQDLADKSAKKLGGMAYIVETSQSVKKGDLWIDLNETSDTESFEAEQELKECDDVVVGQSLKVSVVFTVVDRNTGITVFSKASNYEIESAKTLAEYDAEWKRDFDLIRSEYKNAVGFPAQYAFNFHFHAPLSQKDAMLKNGFFSDTATSVKFEIINYHTVILDDEPTMLVIEITSTVAYTAKPEDSRCSWWCVQVPEDQQLDGHRINAPFLKRGADLELKAGDMLIDSEVNHHRKNRGYTVVLVACDGEKIQYLQPTAQRKKYIKENGGQDLMHETGDVSGCIRMAVWLRRQPDLKVAIQQLLTA